MKVSDGGAAVLGMVSVSFCTTTLFELKHLNSLAST